MRGRAFAKSALSPSKGRWTSFDSSAIPHGAFKSSNHTFGMILNLVRRNRLKVLISLNQNGVRSVVLFSYGNTRTTGSPGNSRNLRHRVNDTEHGKPVLLPCEWQANRKERRGRCG